MSGKDGKGIGEWHEGMPEFSRPSTSTNNNHFVPHTNTQEPNRALRTNHTNRTQNYSKPTAKTLTAAENHAVNSGSQNDSRDIGKQERGGWSSPIIKGDRAADKYQREHPEAVLVKGKMSNGKKGLITGGIIGLVTGGGMFIMAGLLSGPAQLLQIYHFFDDTYNTVHNLTTAFREGRISASLAKGVASSNEQRVVNSRIGVIGRKIANSYQADMAEKGVYLGVDSAGRPTMAIDPNLLITDANYNLQDPNEAGISTSEKNQRIASIKSANNQLAKYADTNGIEIAPIDPSHPNIQDGRVVVDLVAPTQVGALARNASNNVLKILQEKAGVGGMSAAVGMRAYSTKAGFVNALFHPVQAAKTLLNNAVYDKVLSFITRLQATPDQQRANALAQLNADLESQKQPENTGNATADAEAKTANAELDTQIQSNQGELDTLSEKGITPSTSSTNTRRGYLSMVTDEQAAEIQGRLKAVGAATGIISFVVSLLCGLYNLAKSGKIEAIINTVIPAIQAAGVMTNMASQMMAGDLSMDDVGAFTQTFVYDDQYPVSTTSVDGSNTNISETTTDASGNKTTANATASNGKDINEVSVTGSGDSSSTTTTTSSFWDACAVQTELDPTYQCSSAQESAINPQLNTAANGNEATTVMDKITNGLNSVIPGFGTAIIKYGLGALCSSVGELIVTILSVAVTGVVAFFTGDWTGFGLALAGAVVNYAPGISSAAKQGINYALSAAGVASWQDGLIALVQNAVGPAMNMLGNNMAISPLDWITSSPEVKGNIGAYGAYYNAQLTGVQDGGVVLSDQEQVAWNQEVNTYLAEQENQKPLLARLFDPTDYHSMIAQLGRAANVDPNGGLGTQFANMFKMFGALPNLAMSMFFNAPANAAEAASGTISFDYNVPEVAIPLDVLQDMNNLGDDSTDVYANAETVGDILNGSNGAKYDNLAKVCLGKAIDHDDLSVTNVDPTGDGYGIDFYYMQDPNGDYQTNHCSGLMDSTSSYYDLNFVRIAVYAGVDWGIINAQGCYYGDDQACNVTGVQ